MRNKKGQILVIFALALVAILAITALALDGSMTYNVRRTNQSTADSAAMAGAGAAIQLTKDHVPSDFYCGSSLASHSSVAAILAAQQLAANQGITLTQNDGTNGVTVTCNHDFFSQWLDVKVIITTDVPTTFGKIIGQNSVRTQVTATARVYPRQSIAYGNALAAIGEICGYGTGGITLKGGSSITSLGGGIFSNSCINGPNNSSFIMTSGANVAYYGLLNFSGTVVGGDVVQAPDKMPPLQLPKDPCTNPNPTWKSITNSGTYSPGYYNSFNVAKDNQNPLGTRLNPGLYCISGDIIAMGQSVLTGNDVTIYMMNGNIDFAANATINLTACDSNNSDGKCGTDPLAAIQGLVIYFNPNYQRTLAFAPSATSYFDGTILGPTTTVSLQGNADPNALHSQIVCNNFYANGNTNLTINLDSASTFMLDSQLELLK